ncbi:MAG: biotin--[acetyl-CoA-carboxylase] ligase [Clostridia bacterium]|nr:biotin--[acetyl-CoA-carboxylase] ligase [Clostridia bacterium]
MTTKQQIAALLEQHETEYISGSAIANALGLTRAAVWKCVKQLEAEGYDIESAKKGYRLGDDNNALSEGLIRRYLDSGSKSGTSEDGTSGLAERVSLEVLSAVDSTNNYLKRKASQTPSWHAVIASEQTAGRGRMGRTFESPAGTGVYLSVLLRPDLPAQQAVRLTTAAAVAACLAIEECTDSRASIKWVNDVYVNGKKTCGILTEASIDLESGGLDWAVMGIGFNVYEPEDGFPAEIRNIAGAITEKHSRDLRCRIAASFLRHYYDIVETRQLKGYPDEYIKRSFVIGKRINVLRSGTVRPAKALSIDGECRLLVEYEDGTQEALSSGEVSIRPV